MCYSKHFLQYQVIVVNDFSGYKDSNFESMQSDMEQNYSSSSDAACSKKENCVNLLRGWEEDQTFLEILGPI